MEIVETDAELLRAYVQHGSQQAFAQVVARHVGMVYLTARRMLRDAHLAEDATQAVFLLLAQRAGRLSGVAVGGWLYQVTTYTVRNMVRAEMRRRRREQESAVGEAEDVSRAGADSGKTDVDGALARLGAGERDVLVLRYMQGLSVPEVARELGISQQAAGKRLVRAMARIRRILNVDQEQVAAGLTLIGAVPEGLTGRVLQHVVAEHAPTAIAQLAGEAGRSMAMKQAMGVLKVAAMVGLAGVFGAGVWAALPAAEQRADAPSAPASRPAAVVRGDTMAQSDADIVAIDEKMGLWWIDPKSKFRVENGQLIVHSPAADGPAFHAWIGGPSWENHHVSLELMVEEDSSPAQPGRGAATWNVQVCPRNSDVFFQVMARACNICCMMPDGDKRQFTHVSNKPLPPVKPGQWHRLEVISQDRQITMMLDGRTVNAAEMPVSTRGMLGLIVNFGSDAVVRIRNMQVALLDADEQQIAQGQRNAQENWEAENRKLKEQGKPLATAPW